MLNKVLLKLERYLQIRRRYQYIKRFEGVQDCPWCNQCVQDNNERWYFKTYVKNPFLDVLTCGVCTGTSLWRFEMGMIYVRPLDPPVPTKKSPFEGNIP